MAFAHETPILDLAKAHWFVRTDVNDAGRSERWMEEWHEHHTMMPPSTDWMPAAIEEAWQHVLGETFTDQIVWYATRFRVPAGWRSECTVLRFDAVANSCAVWLNGEHVGSHVGDYVPFQFDVSNQLIPGREINIVVRVELVPDHITKGFHDVISLMHGGIWQPVRLIGTGQLHTIPNGIEIRPNVDIGEVRVSITLDSPCETDAACAVIEIRTPDGSSILSESCAIAMGALIIEHICTVEQNEIERWSPEHPALYTAQISLLTEGTNREQGTTTSEAHTIRFGFRTIETRGDRIYLNDRPLFVRGVLDWGHEPDHIAPAPPAGQIHERFEYIRSLGFNAVCLCMYDPPDVFFDIADEMGILIWHEHPVWQSRMDDADLPEYRRLYREFMRRDVNHPSIIIVSATCEHPDFHPDLEAWWWKTAKGKLRDRMLQVQTASFAWSKPEHTDLYDEHTYDNNNRWVTYLQDLQKTLATLPGLKPFVMGETVLFTSWPDIAQIDSQATPGESRSTTWWHPKGLESRREFERVLAARFGSAITDRLHAHGDRHHLLGRKFQMECFRMYENHAGLVMNHLRDVPACMCGILDDFERPRFAPEQTRPWLADAPLLLRTPDHRRSFQAGEQVACEAMISNFSADSIDARIRASLSDLSTNTVCHSSDTDPIQAESGHVGATHFTLEMPNVVARPSALELKLESDHPEPGSNSWTLWVFPESDPHSSSGMEGVYRLSSLAFATEDAAPDEEERRYSRGFGIRADSWINHLPDPAVLVPKAKALSHQDSFPPDARIILTHKLTERVLDFIETGGMVIHFASKTAQSIPTKYEWLFGQVPVVIDIQPPLVTGDSEWIVDLLSFDLTRTYARTIPVDELNLTDRVEPIVRLAYTHDLDEVRVLDMAFWTRVGDGILMVSSLDHHDPVGQFLLDRFIRFVREWKTVDQSADIPSWSRAELEEKLNRTAENPAELVSKQPGSTGL